MAEMEEADAENRAWLKEREHLILANPVLRSMYDLLPSRKARADEEFLDGQDCNRHVGNNAGKPRPKQAAGGDRHHEDSPQPEPANSVLLEEHNEHEQS